MAEGMGVSDQKKLFSGSIDESILKSILSIFTSALLGQHYSFE